jgi:tetratricopeptide (TPR) repeat protein
MFRRLWIVLVLCVGTVASAQSNPEHEKLKKEAQAAYDHGDFAQAREITSKVLAQNPKDHAALYLRASASVEQGLREGNVKDIRAGIEDSRESLKIGGGGEINYYLPYLFGMISLARIENKVEHANVALDVSKTVLARTNLTPEQRANILYQRASAHLFLKDLKSAIEDYQSAIKAFPGHIGSYMGLAECYKIANQPDKVLATYTAAVDAIPNSQLAHNNRGLFLQQTGKNQEAVADFNKAIDLDKNFPVAYANRGYSTQLLGNPSAAEADFSKAIMLEDDNPLFHSLRGTCRLSLGNTAGAIEDYNDAIRLLPENAVVHADLGFAKYFSKDYPGAASAFEQAIQVDENVRQAQGGRPNQMLYLNPWRSWALVLSGKSDAAAEVAEASAKKPEKERDWIDEQVLFLNGKEVSEKDLVEFVNKEPNADRKNKQLCEAYYFIAERRMQAGDKENATTFYQRVLQTKETQLSAYRGAQYALQSFPK